MHPGDVYFHKNFVFHDGAQKDKYLVVIGSNETLLVVAKTTSQGHNYRNDFGCQSANRYPAFFLPQGSCCMPLPTWICLGEFYEFNKAAFTTKILAGEVNAFGKIPSFARDIQFCAIGCDDISVFQEGTIRSSLAPA